MSLSSIDFVLLIPCYNNVDGLINSLKSISYPPNRFEILIVDDGSDIPLTIADLQLNRIKINIIRLNRNQGILNALNTGLIALKHRNDIKYIARLDAGDICHNERFYKQVDFLNTHQDIVLLATWARFKSSISNKGYDYITQTIHNKIVKEMHYKCSFIHPSVMFKKEVIDIIGIYPENFPHAEDYAFFWKILKKGKCAVIPEILVNILFSDKNVSVENYIEQLRSRKKIVKIFGNKWVYKRLGLLMLNIKLMLPPKIVQKLKTAL